MTKLISGRVHKVPSANVSADRYEFIELSETEPDLGLPSQLGQVFTSDLAGFRRWTKLDTANVIESPGNLYYTDNRVVANIANLSINAFYDVIIGPNLTTGKALVYDGNLQAFVPVFVNSEIANIADLAVKVLNLENQSTANVREASSNLYFTNTRVLDAISMRDINPFNVNVNGNITIVSTIYLTTGAVVGNIRLTETLSANALFANNAVIGSGGSITGANLVSATFIQANSWLGLYTANVVESPNNLYYTNARTVQTVTPLLTTANVVESTNNVYFTNARTVQTVTPLLTTGNVVETTNLYFTNARVLSNVEQMSVNVFADVDISGIVVNGVLVWNGTKFVSGTPNSELSNLANVALLANVANSVLSISNFTTANLLEASSNLYFTNTRAIGAFTAGRGIIIQENGVIKSTIGSDLFSTSIDGTVGYTVNNTMSPAVTFPSTPTTSRFILRSMQITNISNQTAFVSGNVLYASSNTALLANKIGVPVGASLEFIKRPQIFTPGDKINLQGFNAADVAANDLLSASFTYETIYDDITYSVAAQTLYASNNNITLLSPDQSYAIVESLKFINHHTDDVTITALWTDSNSATKAYFAFNMPVPASSSMEVLQAPKKINNTDKLIVRYGNAANGLVSAFASYRLGAVTTPIGVTTLADTGGTVSINLQTTITDGTTLYYTIS